MLLFYRFFLLLYHGCIKVLSLWNHKAKLWVRGRKTFPQFNYAQTDNTVVWMHCASLGEFEQGRPLLERIRSEYTNCKMVVSFFSPSGYEMLKNYPVADDVIYLPGDSRHNAKKLVQQINPSLVLWVRYEYWFYYLRRLKSKKIPILLISAVFRGNMPFFKWYGALWRKMLESFTHFFVQNHQSKALLQKIVAAEKITTSGDTRFDRVITIAASFKSIPQIEQFCADKQVVVAGSTWEDDEIEWTHYIKSHPEKRFIIAPHEVDKENVTDVKRKFPGSILYSEWITGQQPIITGQRSVNCLIIDNIGMLSRLYKYATICYVGGGFRSDGLHNILEAAVYGKPVIFGPAFQKNFEAIEMIEQGGAVSISNAIELEKILDQLFSDDKNLKMKGKAAGKYVQNNAGATGKIMQFIRRNAFLSTGQTALQTDQNPSSPL